MTTPQDPTPTIINPAQASSQAKESEDSGDVRALETANELRHRIPRPNQWAEKSLVAKIAYAPRRTSLATLSVFVWCVTLLCLSSMITMPAPDWRELVFKQNWVFFDYALQVPLAVLVAGVLGGRMGSLAILSYLVAGLAGFPIFANGGGFSYLYDPGLGYLIGMAFTAPLIHQELKKCFTMTGWFRGRSFYLLFAAAMAVFSIHTLGALGLLAQVLLGHFSPSEALSWLHHYSFDLLPLDLFFAFCALAFVRFTRLAFFCCLY